MPEQRPTDATRSAPTRFEGVGSAPSCGSHPESLHSVYDEDYFANAEFFSGQNEGIFGYYDYIAERFNRQLSYRELLDEVVALLPAFSAGTSRLLDVGCGLGYLMDSAHDKGFSVAGVEFNQAAAEKLRQKYVFPVHVGDMLGFDGEACDVITMVDVIEHLHTPVAIVRKVNSCLKPGGLFVLTTMDSDSLVSRLLGARLDDFRRVREHLFFFTRDSIRRVLESEGFEVVDIRFHGHTFRLDFLADRIRLLNPFLGWLANIPVKWLRLGARQLHLNPGTKMIVFARKAAAPAAP